MRRSIHAFLIVAAMAASTGVLAAGALPDGPYLIASGTATTDVAPDYVDINFEIEGEALKRADASAAADKQAVKLFTILKAAGVAEGDIRAASITVSPDYQYEDNGNKRTYKGEVVTRVFKVTLRDLSKFSALVQDLLEADLDIGDAEFGSSHKDEIEKHNLEAAIADARKRADDMAAQVGEHVDRVYGMAPGQYSAFITQEFPYGGSYYGASQYGKIEVTGSRVKRTETYLVPKSITFNSNVTIVCTVK